MHHSTSPLMALMPNFPATKDLVLIGGGHTHALVLKMLAMAPVPGLRLTLASDVSYAPYSGMLPGFVAGVYSFDAIHIDLRRLASAAGCVFINAKVTGIDPKSRTISLADRPPLRYDFASVNIGSAPTLDEVPGARTHAVPVKPVAAFIASWAQVTKAFDEQGHCPEIVLVGGGAGGVELALCMRQRLGKGAAISLIQREEILLPTHSAAVRRQLVQLMQERQIRLRLGQSAVAVEAGQVVLADGARVNFDKLYWVTHASAAPWLRDSGLAMTSGGFLRVNAALQSLSHPEVFAVGDVAVIEGQPRPRAGVYAVRQAKPLLANLRRIYTGKPLQNIALQSRYLSLINTGDGGAVAARGPLRWRGRSMWRLKDYIDQKFMRQFTDFGLGMPATPHGGRTPSPQLTAEAEALGARARQRCHGCAAKIGPMTLAAVLTRLKQDMAQAPGTSQSGERNAAALAGQSVLIGLAGAEDAAAIRLAPGQILVQSVDYLPTLVTDPYVFGRIAALHSFNDVLAMGAKPHSLLASVNVPLAAELVLQEQLYQLLAGVHATAELLGAEIIGGHTAEAPELALGLTVNGVATEAELLFKGGLQPGQALILTKAVGTATIFVAAMALQAEGRWIDAAINMMLMSNAPALAVLRQYGTTACTDVSGFGLYGHLLEMVRAARHHGATSTGRGANGAVLAQLRVADVPVLPGALECLERGYYSTLQAANMQLSASAVGGDARGALLFDPQTAGGLLAAVPTAVAAECVLQLKRAGYADACVIGTTVAAIAGNGEPCVQIC